MPATIFAIAFLFTTMTRLLEGTLMKINDAKPASITVNVSRQFQTFVLGKRAIVERESRFTDDGAPTTAKIPLADLTPGEFVRLQTDSNGQLTRVHAIARVDRATVRSVNGSTVVLEDGTELTISPVLRFVNERGKTSETASVRRGQTVLLFRHPETGNIYRFAAVRKRAAS